MGSYLRRNPVERMRQRLPAASDGEPGRQVLDGRASRWSGPPAAALAADAPAGGHCCWWSCWSTAWACSGRPPLAEVTLGRRHAAPGQADAQRRPIPTPAVRQIQFKTANREFDPARQDFRWVPDGDIRQRPRIPADVLVLERAGQRRFLRLPAGPENARGSTCPPSGDRPSGSPRRCGRWPPSERETLEPVGRRDRRAERPAAGSVDVRDAEGSPIGRAGRAAAGRRRRAGRAGRAGSRVAAEKARRSTGRSQRLVARQQAAARPSCGRNVAVFADGQGSRGPSPWPTSSAAIGPTPWACRPKLGHYLAKVWELLASQPRESNTEGGLFPAIFGTVHADLPHGRVLLSPGRAGRHLPGRVCPRRPAGAAGADRREQPGRHPVDRLRHFRPGVLHLRRWAAHGPLVLSRAGGGRRARLRHRRRSSGPA